MKDNRFVVYKLQKLAILLRILGFDVLYFQNEKKVYLADVQIVIISCKKFRKRKLRERFP
jgi:uncharacterized protein with PIN domain